MVAPTHEPRNRTWSEKRDPATQPSLNGSEPDLVSVHGPYSSNRTLGVLIRPWCLNTSELDLISVNGT